MNLLAAGLAILVGISLGLLGGGGSVLTVPILTYALHMPAKLAVVMSLGIVGTTSLIGAIPHWRAGNVSGRVALLFGPAAVVGAIAGAHIAKLLTGSTQLTIFGVVVLIGSVMMWRSASRPDGGGSSSADVAANARMGLLAIEGFFVGVLTAVIGVGGGFLIVPALVGAASVPMRVAIGTSLVIIAMNAASGFSTYLISGTQIPWGLAAGFTAFAIAGSFIGARFARKVPVPTLKKMFAGILVLMAIYVLYRR